VVVSSANLAQILHGEREASLQRIKDDLASTNSELERHRELNERLESDLLKIEQHGQGQNDQENGDANPVDSGEDDILAGLGLELGLTTKDVRYANYCPMQLLTLAIGRRILWYKRNLYLSHPPPTHPSFPLSQANATASVNVMLNSKR
jgi:homeobox protein cut-like